jgi:hypothetical protein
MMALRYIPFDDPSAEVRVLALMASSEPLAELSAHLFHVPLASAKYEALSYAWGDPTINQGILKVRVSTSEDDEMVTEIQAVRIGENLTAALHHLRHATKSRYLWVDAICINQRSNAEKSKQVRMMDKIYDNASQVVCWLGPGTPETDHAITMIGVIGSVFRTVYEEYSRFKVSNWYEECCLGWAWGPLFLRTRCQYLNELREQPGFSLEDRIQELRPRVRPQMTRSIEFPPLFFGEKFLQQLKPLYLELFDPMYYKPDEAFHIGLGEIFGRKYWTRVWVRYNIPSKEDPAYPFRYCKSYSLVQKQRIHPYSYAATCPPT